MNLWENFFGKAQGNETFAHELHKKVASLMPNSTQEDQLYTACIAGLLARVAFVDFEIHHQEKSHMMDVLQEWGTFSAQDSQAITSLAIEHVKELSGLENHLYCVPLSENLSVKRRYAIVLALFALAASDGSVDNNESEEIRTITTGLLLEHKHYISARASVLDKLAALKS